MTHSSRFSALLLVGLLAACGGKSFEASDTDPEGGSSQGGSQAGSSQGGSGSKAGSSQGGAAPHAGSGGVSTAGTETGGFGAGGSTSVCDSYDDEAGTNIGVDIINNTTAVIYLGQEEMTCSQEPLFEVSSPRGLPLTPLGTCRASCDIVAKSGNIGCPAVCFLPSAITLQPGEA
ncbi:MAG TPA: hypothetical protein VEQ58_00065, partial [Polyangiaceae bacterium]|nr:hypothetical protein [Polyangiaceae bacterium]